MDGGSSIEVPHKIFHPCFPNKPIQAMFKFNLLSLSLIEIYLYDKVVLTSVVNNPPKYNSASVLGLYPLSYCWNSLTTLF